MSRLEWKHKRYSRIHRRLGSWRIKPKQYTFDNPPSPVPTYGVRDEQWENVYVSSAQAELIARDGRRALEVALTIINSENNGVDYEDQLAIMCAAMDHLWRTQRACLENAMAVEDRSTAVIDFMNRMGKKKFRPVKATVSAINARLKDGYTLEQIYAVVEWKWFDWGGTDMERYYRPITIFAASKFDSYLNEVPPEIMNKHTGEEVEKTWR